MLNWISKLVDRFLVVLCAVACIQFPLFMHQYRMQLVGHVEELAFQVDAMSQAAMESGKTLEQFIQKFLKHHDPDFSKQGEIMHGMLTRWREFSDALAAFDKTSVWSKPLVFVRHLNWDIARSTFNEFEPGIVFSYEGVLYAVMGIFIGYGAYLVLYRFVIGIFKRFRKNRLVQVK